MSLPRMQHYLPQSYLRGFTMNGSKKSKLRVIGFLDRKCFSASPKDVAKIRDYYVFQNNNGEVDYRVETELFSKLDGDAARIIRSIEERKEIPAGQDWTTLCLFVAFLRLRIPQFRQASQEFAQYYFDMMLHFRCQTPEAFEQFKKEYKSQTGKPLDTTYEEFKESSDSKKYFVEVPRTNDVKLMLDTATESAQIVCHMTPHLLISSGEGQFVTGDVPVCLFDTNKERRMARLEGVGWATKEVEVTIPLTSRICLVLNWDGRPKLLEADDFNVADCNLLRAAASQQYLFAPHGNVPFHKNGQDIIWGEDALIEHFAEKKKMQVGTEIRGPIERRPPERIRR